MPINIYLDLSKAFDTIDHTILIDKLKYYGVLEINQKLFSSYLENHKQYTEIDNVKSNTSLITTGVPFKSCAVVLKTWAIFVTLYCSSSLSCINEYMAIDSGVCVRAAFTH